MTFIESTIRQLLSLFSSVLLISRRMWWLFVHAAICVSFLASALATWFPKNLPALRRASSVGHLLLGACLLLTPGYFNGITVQGHFNTLHSFLQAYCSAFHLAIAYFLLSPAGFPDEKPFVFGQAFVALLSLLTKLLTAWHLTEKTTRGLLISDQFILCAFLTDGAWLLCESVKLFTYRKTNQDEIDQMCKRTTLWLEGKGSFYLENAFYIDAAVSLLMAVTHFAFPQHILKIVITSEYLLDSHHIMWCRMFGCLSLLPALCSLSARHLPPQVQTHYLASRLITQVIVFLLNVFGHWYLGVFSPNHISGFMISGFYMSFLFSAFYRASSQYKNLPQITIRQKNKAI
ncbi:hypothetical protein GCK32_000153 [Trichostrongylus colubriformis]|uniref:Uncharacterized protein n=1 Tax=Trichostrongylus colubriformis TaxID=6319 RepID=A0AAN8FSN7_TRICO